MAGGAVFWTDFIYDDHGATGLPVNIPTGGLMVPPRGTYIYPDGPAARNGADIFRVGDRAHRRPTRGGGSTGTR